MGDGWGGSLDAGGLHLWREEEGEACTQRGVGRREGGFWGEVWVRYGDKGDTQVLGHWVAGGTIYLHWDTGRGARWKRDDPPLWMCWDAVAGGQGERPGGAKGLAGGSAPGERGGKV